MLSRKTFHNARYAKLRGHVWDMNLDISNLVWRGMTNLRLLRTSADLFTNRMGEKQVIGKGLI